MLHSLQGSPQPSSELANAPVENVSQSPGMENFRAALKGVLSVSKSEVDRLRTREQAKAANRPKRGPKTDALIS